MDINQTIEILRLTKFGAKVPLHHQHIRDNNLKKVTTDGYLVLLTNHKKNNSMKKITIFLLLFIVFAEYAKAEQLPDNNNKFGIGITYDFNSVVTDSLKPIELSLRYRLNNKHTFQIYTPLALKKTSIHNSNETRKKTFYGIGVGYDYTFYTYSHLNLFTGLDADYGWYNNQWDFHRIYDVYDEELPYKTEDIYLYWDKIKGMSISPNIGIRFSILKVTTELKISLPITDLRKKSYSIAKTRTVHLGSWTTWEAYYPDKNTHDLSVQSNIKFNLSYYF